MEKIILEIFAVAVPLIFAISVHEAAHGYVASLFGDDTAKRMGRITLNPVKHFDPIGSLLVPGALYMAHLPVLGWAKPVPVDFDRLRSPKADMLWVAAAGPASNLVQAILWAVLLAFLQRFQVEAAPWQFMAVMGIQVNVVLMTVNLLPIPPFDGGRIAVSLLPMRQAIALSKVEPYGFYILIGLLFLGGLEFLLRHVALPIIELMRFFSRG